MNKKRIETVSLKKEANIIYIATYAVRKRKSCSLVSTKPFNTRSRTAGKASIEMTSGKTSVPNVRAKEGINESDNL